MPKAIAGLLQDAAPLNHQPPLCLSSEGPSYQDGPRWVHAQHDNWQAGIMHTQSFGTEVGLACPALQSSVTHTQAQVSSERGQVFQRAAGPTQAKRRLHRNRHPCTQTRPCNIPHPPRHRGELACVWQGRREATGRNKFKQLSPNYSQDPQWFEKQEEGPKQSERRKGPRRASFFKFT